jgi:hypothetical protein
VKANGERCSYHSLMSDNANFNTAPITGKHDQRGQAFIQEIGELDPLPGFVQDLTVRQLHELEVRAKAVPLSLRN